MITGYYNLTLFIYSSTVHTLGAWHLSQTLVVRRSVITMCMSGAINAELWVVVALLKLVPGLVGNTSLTGSSTRMLIAAATYLVCAVLCRGLTSTSLGKIPDTLQRCKPMISHLQMITRMMGRRGSTTLVLLTITALRRLATPVVSPSHGHSLTDLNPPPKSFASSNPFFPLQPHVLASFALTKAVKSSGLP